MPRDTSYKRVVKMGDAPPPLPVPTTAPIQEENRQVQPHQAPKGVTGKVLTTMEIRSRIQGLMHKMNYDPIAELMTIAVGKDPATGAFLYPLETRISIHKELANYVAPKLKSSDLQVEQSMDITINLVKFSDTGQVRAPNRESIPVLVKELKEA